MPITGLAQVQPETNLLAAMTTMEQAHQSQVPVVQGGEIAGPPFPRPGLKLPAHKERY